MTSHLRLKRTPHLRLKRTPHLRVKRIPHESVFKPISCYKSFLSHENMRNQRFQGCRKRLSALNVLTEKVLHVKYFSDLKNSYNQSQKI